MRVSDSDEIPVVRDDVNSPVHRALAIVELLGSDEVSGSLGVVEIARRLGRDKSQVSRALRMLADIGFVDREPRTLRYRIGTRLFAVAAKAVDRRLREEADEVAARLAALLGERVEVLVRCGAEAVTISSAAPGQMLLAVGWVGRTQPLPSTAAGRCLLFDSSAEEIARLLAVVGIEGGGPQVPRSLDEVVHRVRADAARGYSLCVQESDREFLGIGVPINDVHARTVAGLQVCGPQRRMEEAMDETIKQAIAAAQVISAALGGSGSRPPTAPTETRAVGTGTAGA